MIGIMSCIKFIKTQVKGFGHLMIMTPHQSSMRAVSSRNSLDIESQEDQDNDG